MQLHSIDSLFVAVGGQSLSGLTPGTTVTNAAKALISVGAHNAWLNADSEAKQTQGHSENERSCFGASAIKATSVSEYQRHHKFIKCVNMDFVMMLRAGRLVEERNQRNGIVCGVLS